MTWQSPFGLAMTLVLGVLVGAAVAQDRTKFSRPGVKDPAGLGLVEQ